MGRYVVIKNGQEISSHNTRANANKSQEKHGGYVQYFVGKTEARAAERPRKSKTCKTGKVAKTTKRKSVTRRRRSGNLFRIDRVPTLI